MARKYGIPVSLFLAQIHQESGFQPNARSGAGAVGIAQIVPKFHPGVDATDPVASLNYAAKWMSQLKAKYGNWSSALSVYNSGNPNAYKDPNFAGGQTFNYVKDILGSAGKPTQNGVTQPGVVPAVSTVPGGGRQLQGVPQPHYNVAPLLKLLQQNGAIGAYNHLRSIMPITPTVTPGQLPPSQQIPKGAVKIQGPVTANDIAAVKLAKSFIGTHYVYGGSSPKTGFDCSGLLQYVWGTRGVNIPRTTYDQFQTGKPVGRGQLRVGDAVFFKGSDAHGDLPGHVGMYLGNGKYIEAPHTGATVRISLLKNASDYVGARRYG